MKKNNMKTCPQCQFESGKHSRGCSLFIEPKNPQDTAEEGIKINTNNIFTVKGKSPVHASFDLKGGGQVILTYNEELNLWVLPVVEQLKPSPTPENKGGECPTQNCPHPADTGIWCDLHTHWTERLEEINESKHKYFLADKGKLVLLIEEIQTEAYSQGKAFLGEEKRRAYMRGVEEERMRIAEEISEESFKDENYKGKIVGLDECLDIINKRLSTPTRTHQVR